jgi:hypothetical protein
MNARAVKYLYALERHYRGFGLDAAADDVHAQIVAVAKLIDATRTLVAESVHPYDHGEYEEGEWPALDSARAALESVGGAP